MNPPGAGPTDGAQADQLLERAFAEMKCERWEEAARLLESAVVVAPAEIRNAAADILASIYIGLNHHRPLRSLLRIFGPVGPQLLKASLVLLRNDAIGIEDEPLPLIEPAALKTNLAAQRASGGIAPIEYAAIVALLVHLRWLEDALDWMEPLISSRSLADEGVLEQLLAALKAAGRHADASNLLTRLEASPASGKLPLIRWRYLIDTSGPSAATKPFQSEDKVLLFLALSAAPAEM